jgi:hypothetical protein
MVFSPWGLPFVEALFESLLPGLRRLRKGEGGAAMRQVD